MKKIFGVLAGLLVLAAVVSPVAAAQDTTFAGLAFQNLWNRTDPLVASGEVARTWLWGPVPKAVHREAYAQSPGGTRLVQYFDKARMEINHPFPSGDPNSPWFVTTGLLSKELITGQLQVGDAQFQQRGPANVPAAGDPDSPTGPTYATFGNLLGPVGARQGAVMDTLDRAGNVGQNGALGNFARYAVFVPETGHNIPSVFFNFLDSDGLILQGGQVTFARVFDPTFFVTGFPITEAFWSSYKVAGVQRDVLVQAYERRVLTFTPGNPPGFQVEMGNVGLHYHIWRYGTPPDAPSAKGKIVFTSNRDGNDEVYSVNPDGSRLTRLTFNPGRDRQAAISPDGQLIAFGSERGGPAELWVMNQDGSNQHRVTSIPNTTIGGASWSPDGSKIAFDATTPSSPHDIVEIYVAGVDGSGLTQVTHEPAIQHGGPAFTPDGQKIVFERFDFVQDRIFIMDADGSNQVDLTNRPGFDDATPSVSPDGRTIVFATNRDGNYEIYTMDINGANQNRLTFTPAEEALPHWSADGLQIVLHTNRDGNREIYTMNPDGSRQQNVSNNPADDQMGNW